MEVTFHYLSSEQLHSSARLVLQDPSSWLSWSIPYHCMLNKTIELSSPQNVSCCPRCPLNFCLKSHANAKLNLTFHKCGQCCTFKSFQGIIFWFDHFQAVWDISYFWQIPRCTANQIPRCKTHGQISLHLWNQRSSSNSVHPYARDYKLPRAVMGCGFAALLESWEPT